MMFDKVVMLNSGLGIQDYKNFSDDIAWWQYFVMQFSYSNNVLQGDGLSKREVRDLYVEDKIAKDRDFSDHLKMFNHFQILGDLGKLNIPFSGQVILDLYNRLNYGVGDREEKFRNASVQRKIEQFCYWLNHSKNIHPVKFAIDAHFGFVAIKPFAKNNAQLARILMNEILLKHGFAPFFIRRREQEKYQSLISNVLTGDKKSYREFMLKNYQYCLEEYLALQKGKKQHIGTEKLFKIGEFANQVGETKATIRHWTKLGVLDVEEVIASGYQFYSEEMIDVVTKIKKLKKQRYSLEEIKKKLG